MTDYPYPPRYKKGDRVISFRGEKAEVLSVIPSKTRAKSHKYLVQFDNGSGFHGPYYESVFDPDHDYDAGVEALKKATEDALNAD